MDLAVRIVLALTCRGSRAKPGSASEVGEFRPLTIPGATGKMDQDNAFPVKDKLPQVFAGALVRSRLLPILKVEHDRFIPLNGLGIEEVRIFNGTDLQARILA